MPYVIPIVIAAAGAAVQATAASRAATTAARVADYNAKIDISNAQQLQLDAAANVRRQRDEDSAYRSRIRVAYAAAGILSGEGTPMQVEATTAGRQEQDVQNYWRSVNQKTDKYYGAAAEGVIEGKETASLYHLQGAASILKGIGSMASAYGSGGSTSLSTTTKLSGGWTGQDSGAAMAGYT